MRTVEHITRELRSAEKEVEKWQERAKKLREERAEAVRKLTQEV